MTDLIAPDWAEQDANNTGVAPNGVQGSYSPSQIAPILRAIRGASKRAYVQGNALYSTTGTGAAYVLTYAQGPTAYSKGIVYRFWAHVANTGACTLNINGLGAKSLLSARGEPLSAGQIAADDLLEVVYNGTSFELIGAERHNPKFTGTLTANAATIAALSGNTASFASATFTGAVSALSFTGSGAALTALNGSNISTGTVADARLPTSMAGKTFTTAVTANATITAVGGATIKKADGSSSLTMGGGIAGKIIFDTYNTDNTAKDELALNYYGGDVTINKSIAWHAGNDGAGSGLDADLLDGQQGSYYRDLTNSTGTLPSARLTGSYSFTGLTLSGTLAAEFAQLQSASGNTTLRLRNPSGVTVANLYNDLAADNLVLRKVNGTTGANEGYIRIDGNGSTDFKHNGSTVWTEGNDGSGSGLDSDLLDGQHGSYFRDLGNSTGTLPDARLAASTYNMSALNLSNRLEIKGSAPYISFIYTTANEYSARMSVNSNNIYLQASTDDVNFSTVFQFELDTKRGYVNGSEIRTASNILNIGTSASSARSALGLGQLATENWSDLVYGGTSSTNTVFPVGSILLCVVTGWKNRNSTVTVRNNGGDSNFHEETGTVLTGTWRARGSFSAGDRYSIVERVS